MVGVRVGVAVRVEVGVKLGKGVKVGELVGANGMGVFVAAISIGVKVGLVLATRVEGTGMDWISLCHGAS